jgi:phage-related protein
MEAIVNDFEFDVKFYDAPNGKKPAKDFIEKLEPKMRAKMLRLVNMLATNGNELHRPYAAYLRNDIYELRATVGSNTTRVLYFFFTKRRIILTHGFVKKTDEVPPGEIQKAIKYRDEYLNREEHELDE